MLFPDLAFHPGDVFPLTSSRGDKLIIGELGPGNQYTMMVHPDGHITHDYEGCERERFGFESCSHVEKKKGFVVTTEPATNETDTAVAKYQPNQALIPSRIDFSDGQLRAIANVICKGADAAFTNLFLGACKHSGLDPFLKQIYALNIRGRWTIYVGIDGWRVLAERTGLFDGMDNPLFSETGRADDWWDVPQEPKPKYCKVSVYRKGISRPFTAVCAMDAYFQDQAGNRWERDPAGMLAKCTEAQAERRAFPADMRMLVAGGTPVETMNEDEMPEPPPAEPDPNAVEGEYRDLSEAGEPDPPASAEVGSVAATEPPPAPEEDGPPLYVLLNQIGDKQGTGMLVQVKAWMGSHFPYIVTEGVAQHAKLNPRDRRNVTQYLRDLLREGSTAAKPNHEVDPTFDPDVLICNVCKVKLPDEQLGLGQ